MSNLRQFIQETKISKGATYNLTTGEINPTNGYFIALAERELKLKGLKGLKKEVQSYVLKNSDKLSNKDYFLGSWIEGDTLFLDIVIKLDNREEAIIEGLKNKQLAIYDANNKEVINL